jgi:hypothetical protein
MIFPHCTRSMEGFLCLNDTLRCVLLPCYAHQLHKPSSLKIQFETQTTYQPFTTIWYDVLFRKQLQCAVKDNYSYSPCPRLWTMVFKPSEIGNRFIESEQRQNKIELFLMCIIELSKV